MHTLEWASKRQLRLCTTLRTSPHIHREIFVDICIVRCYLSCTFSHSFFCQSFFPFALFFIFFLLRSLFFSLSIPVKHCLFYVDCAFVAKRDDRVTWKPRLFTFVLLSTKCLFHKAFSVCRVNQLFDLIRNCEFNKTAEEKSGRKKILSEKNRIQNFICHRYFWEWLWFRRLALCVSTMNAKKANRIHKNGKQNAVVRWYVAYHEIIAKKRSFRSRNEWKKIRWTKQKRERAKMTTAV